MGDFFKGWRRKVGLLTLFVALVFMGGWMRSRFRYDYFGVRFGSALYQVVSVGSGIDFSRVTGHDEPEDWDKPDAWGWPNLTISSSANADPFRTDGNSMEYFHHPDIDFMKVEWLCEWGGFHFGSVVYYYQRDLHCIIPYWAITIPLTLISLRLLLSKPRKSNQMKISEPIPEKVV